MATELLDVRRDVRGKGGHQWVIGNARLNGVLHVVDRLLQLGQDEQNLLQSEAAAIQRISHIFQRLGSLLEGLLEGFEQLQGRIPQLFGQIQQQLGLELHIGIKATGHGEGAAADRLADIDQFGPQIAGAVAALHLQIQPDGDAGLQQ